MCSVEIEPAITTPRLALRRPRKADAPRLAVLLNDINVARMTSRIPHPYDLAAAEAFVDRAGVKDPRREANFVIEHPALGPIGGLGFHAQDESPLPEIGYWLGRAFWGEGFATEAAVGALDWARDGWRKRAVRAGHFADNPASGQVLCKAGFLYTGDVEQRPSIARGAPAATRMMVWLA
jgi:RimJ/RimL family protein N-acetyltransferase